MTRSHPPTLLSSVRRTLVEECAIRSGERILVAVSGGGDSAALLHALSKLAPDLGVSLVAHGVDHGLRNEAAAELDVAGTLAMRCGVPFERTSVCVARGGNLQARARLARRQALERAAEACSASRIATAHHQDDRAETVLIRLLGGADPFGLAVLPATAGIWIRPLIRTRKSAVLAHLQRHGVEYVEDPSNRDPRFLRVRVRSELLPMMLELSPGIVDHLTRLADDIAALGGKSATQVVDEAGAPISLRRTQAQALRRALQLGRPAKIRLSRDREIDVDPRSGQIRVDRAKAPVRGQRTQKGGAKSGKSG